MMYFLATEDLVAINQEVIEKDGGIHGIRDHNLLESSVAAPRNTYYYDLNSSIFDIAAIYAFSIAKNHSFLDGNKRTGLASCVVFLKANSIKIKLDQEEAVNKMVQIATDEIKLRSSSLLGFSVVLQDNSF